MNIENELQQLRHELQHLKDRQAILDCIVRETRGRDRHDAAMTSSCYWEDGADEHGPMICPGPKYGQRANAGHSAFFSANSHNLANHTCEIAGDIAWCETYVFGGLLSLDQKKCTIALGRYVDELHRRNGVWKIKHRRTVIDMASEGDASWLHSPAVSGFLKGLRSPDDPSYRRPIQPDPNDERW